MLLLNLLLVRCFRVFYKVVYVVEVVVIEGLKDGFADLVSLFEMV